MSAKITIKSDIEHIRLRPGMYIGSTYDPNHLLQEIVDNSLDELINNYASRLDVFFEGNDHVIVTDNGRGIPVHDIEVEEGKHELSIIAAATRLKSGAKFDNEAYGLSIGLHGIGLVAVNALSKMMRITVKDQNNPRLLHDIYFEDAELKWYNKIEDDADYSTRVEFQIDPKHFTIPTFSTTGLKTQFELTKATFPNANLYINGQEIVMESLDEFAKQRLDLPVDVNLLNHKIKFPNLNLDCYFTYDLNSSAAPITAGAVNLRVCTGRFLTNFSTLFANCITEIYGNVLTKNEILSHFRLFITSFIPDPQFDSQSKVNMSKDLSIEMAQGREDLKRLLLNPFIKEIIQTLINNKSLKSVKKKITKTRGRVTAKNPLRDCLKTPGKTLWLLEGDSAMGNLLKIRDTKYEGVYPLTGKIPNVVSKTITQVADSKKIRYLFEALGAELKPNSKQTDFRYEEIKILCDADPDGHHIIVLLLILNWFYFPYFLNNQKLTIIVPPLYGAYDKNKKFIPLYSAQEAMKYKNYRRYKGIGEMNEDQLEVVIRGGGIEYIPQPPKTQSEAEALIRCLDDVELKRRLCLEKDKFKLENLFPTSKLIQTNVNQS